MSILTDFTELFVKIQEDTRKEEREKAVQATMDLFFALKDINGKPSLRDLVKLAKRIRRA